MAVSIRSLQADKVEFNVYPHGIYIKFPCGQTWKITPTELETLCDRGLSAVHQFGQERSPKFKSVVEHIWLTLS